MRLLLCAACILLNNKSLSTPADILTTTFAQPNQVSDKTSSTLAKKELVRALYEIGAIQTGDFILKSGIHSPIYFDMRLAISYPKLLRALAEEIAYTIQYGKANVLCGVPHAAVPLATLVSSASDIAMIMPRKEIKAYGTQKAIEGHFKSGDTCLVCEDVMTSGASILETIKIIKDHGLQVTDVVVLIDREQGGKQHVEAQGYTVHALFTTSEILQILLQDDTLTPDQFSTIANFAQTTQQSRACYACRAQLTDNLVAKKLFHIMDAKQTNLAVAADVTTKAELLSLADAIGPEICFLKTHIDIIQDFDADLILQLKALAKKHNFLIVEDRKFADIGSTVQQQYTGGLYTIVDWADIVIAHALSGPDIITALADAASGYERGVLLIAQLSSAGNLIDTTYSTAVRHMAERHKDFVIGFIAQQAATENSNFVTCTPGVSITEQKDGLGQQYNTPGFIIQKQNSDIIIVGRAIYHASDPVAAARQYRSIAWQAYLDTLR